MYSNLFFIERFQWVNHELNELLEGVDENVFLRVPNHGGWCVGEIISHINKTTDLYLSQMEPPFEKKECACVYYTMALELLQTQM